MSANRTPQTDALAKRWQEIGRRVPRMWEEQSRRFETALQSIAANTCCGNCNEAALVARKALENHEKDRVRHVRAILAKARP